MPLLQFKTSIVVSSSYLPIMGNARLCAKIELWVLQTTEIGVLKVWMQQELEATMLQKDFLSMGTFLNLMFSRLSRFIVDLITVDIIAGLKTLAEFLRAKKLKIHTSGSYNPASSVS